MLAMVLCMSSAVIFSASAAAAGDVDGNGSVTAADARLALRASVNLEKLTAAQTKAADIDGKAGVTAADARLILRASVGLEVLHKHVYTSSVTKNATCSTDGEITKTCECGEVIKEAIPATGHSLKEMKITKAATAGSYGEAEFACNKCTETVKLTLCTHTMTKLNIEKLTPCSVAGCKGQFPSFNLLVNQLKSPTGNNRQYSFSKAVATTEKAKATANNKWDLVAQGLAKTFQDMLNSEMTEGTETEYSPFISNRHINSATFPVTGKSYVSDLKDGEVKSLTSKKMSGIDFVKNLPDEYTPSGSKFPVNLKPIKNSDIKEVYKVSVVLKPESCSTKNAPVNNSPIERIIQDDFNEGLAENIDSLKGVFDDSPEMAGFMEMETSITTNCTVDYYFTTDTFSPVCARYNYDVKTSNNTYVLVNDDGEKQKDPYVTITIDATIGTESYYFFNDNFNIK